MAVRLGLIGCGKIGQRHLQALTHLPEAVLVATADTDLARAEAAAVPFDARAFGSPEALIAAGGVDAVIVATPSGYHPDLAQLAMEQGLDVLVEKPLALSFARARELVEFAAKAGLVLATTHFNRMLPAVAQVLAAVRAGALGRLLSGGVAVRWARPQAYYDEAPWRGQRALDGGILFNQAIHALDLAVQVFGPAEEAFCYAATQTHRIEAEDLVAGSVRFRSGALVTVSATTSVPETNLEERLTIVGSEGVAVLGPEIHRLAVWRARGDPDDRAFVEAAAQAAEEPWPRWKSHFNALRDFVTAVATRQPPELAAASALDALALVEALTRSGQTGRPVSVAELEAAS